MDFDYREIGFLDRISNFIKSGTFFTIQTAGSALGVAEAKFAEKIKFSNGGISGIKAFRHIFLKSR